MIVVRVAAALLVGALVWLVYKLKEFVSSKIKDIEDKKLRDIVETFVNAAEQLLKDEDPTGEKRKEYVINQLHLLEIEVNGFVNAVVNFFKSIPGKLVSFAQGIVNVFTSIPGKMMNVGKNIAQGLWNGISGLKDWVINKVKNMGKSILNAIKNVLGVHSPSTEFAWVAKMTVIGYTEELDEMTKTVQGQIAETFSVSPQLANSSALHYSPSVNTTVNVSQTQDPLGRMVNDIKTFSGGAKNDYNYGMGV